MTPQSWSIIIFAFNEENSIQKVIEECFMILEKIAPLQHELIIIDDGSTDNTLLNIKNTIINKTRVNLIKHETNKGIGEALLTGYRSALFENICAIPADGQFDVSELLPFAIIPERTIVSFYRIEKTRYSLYRKILSFGNKFFNKYFLGISIKDVNWIKIYKNQFFKEINPALTSSLVESEICAKMLQNNYNFIEVESKYLVREHGTSKGSNLKTLFKAIKETIKLFITIRCSSKKQIKSS